MERHEVIIIGAGQSGLALGYFLKKAGVDFVIIEKNSRIGNNWRKRYDSLKLFSPNNYNSLPGLKFPGNPEHYPTKNEAADYLETYAKKFDIPILLDTDVQKLTKNNNGFEIETSRGLFSSEKLVVATGPFQKPFIPEFANDLSKNIFQIHTSNYKNPEQLPEGKVLIVGSGNSGSQIAVELSKTRGVFLSTKNRLKFLPYKVLGKSFYWWMEKFGIMHARTDRFLGHWLAKKPEPIIGSALQDVLKNGWVILKSEVVGISNDKIIFADGEENYFSVIIWATGFTCDFSWIKILGALLNEKSLVERKGISNISGLYFLGLKNQRALSSGLLRGAERDAKFIFDKLRE